MRRAGGRRFVVKRKRVYKRKAASTVALKRRVNYLARSIRQKNTPLLLGRFNSLNVVQPVTSYGLDQYSSMSTIFGTGTNDMHCNRAIDRSDVMDITVQLDNLIQTEPSTCNFTCYVVQLKDAIGTNYTSVGALNLVAGQHYQAAPLTGQNVLLNLKYFRILKTKKFILTNYGQPLTSSSGNTQDTFKRWTWKLKRRTLIQNPEGDFNARPPIDPSQARFLLIFSDDSNADSQSPLFTVNHVKAMTQLA